MTTRDYWIVGTAVLVIWVGCIAAAWVVMGRD